MGFFLIWQFIFIFLNQYISYAVYVQSAGEDNYIFEVTLNKKGLSLSFFKIYYMVLDRSPWYYCQG